MAETIAMPKWGLTMEEGTIVEWMVGEGDTVQQGDVLAVVETEKTSVELTSPFSGVVARVLVADGETVPVGTPLLVLASSPEEAAQLR
ncbi:biotin/lipoyl-containing protein [Thermogemmatispora sp.]|uniref:biotin/lipoyl-containing protein n=1 Tax=Thermogemmatispora sp. TaxID=1968838 RepID=UPI001D9499D6|nr:biotin/lipoyl-containing protein [Thermogemmatispora sp.]MBX5449242.1 biotin/lipoyl-binding protein [Thermogemmatispora sp.]